MENSWRFSVAASAVLETFISPITVAKDAFLGAVDAHPVGITSRVKKSTNVTPRASDDSSFVIFDVDLHELGREKILINDI